MINDIRKQRTRFYDDLNFPEGFRRCGLFTVLEAEFLTQNGQLLKALAECAIEPILDEEREFVDAIVNGATSTQLSVKVWRKYQLAIEHRRAKRFFMSAHCGNGQIAINT
ncbi:DUF413 domain-containing protein [Psychrosphaera sp. B3R10]|uniref:DUF413 domain-containing protein n=1 Tax=unclassified Psychrosphaera TaxID=2641570 RepID=UPI001C09438D|nr:MULTISPECIES: DUF413 domain-containing protein [unclassified Psychrosphaera]MBU2883322.1 DUF413 domain-containing protein [Psychrosphaera sp. I2R16]MBU2990584.1 DUF413 domain-containing protein [Psychrosphaera sp. B3R10]MDO6718942.1 DUF413 domain-containing protein [Psychrosphaera sp. 1_MG-2023]